MKVSDIQGPFQLNYNEAKRSIERTDILDEEQISKYFDRCDFDDECEYCDNPKYGSWAAGSSGWDGYEVDYYICGECASKVIPELEKQRRADGLLHKKEFTGKKLKS